MKPPRPTRRPRLAVFKFASCGGCQLSLLDCRGEILAVAAEVEIASFPELSTDRGSPPFELGLVEGSITTPADAERIRAVRAQCRALVAMGACATAGGIQALRNSGEASRLAAMVYPHPELLSTLETSTPISAHVPVDFELQGCPVNPAQLLEVISALLHARKPAIPDHSVCLECKDRGAVCVAVAGGMPCLGPVTRAGCGALCPAYHRGCYGCFGPKEAPNLASLTEQLGRAGTPEAEVHRRLRTFYSEAAPFRKEGGNHGR